MHLPPIILDLAIILGVAALVTFLFRLIKQPVVLGYIVAGIIVGPFSPPLVAVVDVEGVKVWAELGVIIFMFALGLEFSFRRLAKVGVSAAVTAVIQILALMTVGYLCAKALDYTSREAIFVGCMLAISSTTIIIKTFAETGLKTSRFAELVIGILVVQDLAAILMLVALTNIATSDSASATDLLLAAAKLALVVATWLLVGMFIVPRVVKAVSKRGSSEMLIIVSLGLCLALVCLSAYFQYSVALGAFIMGSILAETTEARRIESLVAPLKDVFGAIFFVSVGMLLDPRILGDHLGSVAVLCAALTFGNIVWVGFAALLTGQTLATAIQAGVSLAQIGEFSFIIAVLGIKYKAIDHDLYPIIVAVSLISTFSTPYLIRAAPDGAAWLQRRLPLSWLQVLDRYSSWFLSRIASRRATNSLGRRLIRWGANAILVTMLFSLVSHFVLPRLNLESKLSLRVLCWVATFVCASPFIHALLTPGAGKERIPSERMLRSLATVVLLGVLSAGFFSLRLVAMVTMALGVALLLLFRRQVSRSYQWFERTFFAGINAGADGHTLPTAQTHDHLVPWDAHLAQIDVGYSPMFMGKTLIDLALRERFGINIMVIKRGEQELVAPTPGERIYPNDKLLCFGTDRELATFQTEIQQAAAQEVSKAAASSFLLRPAEIPEGSAVAGKTIREVGIRESFGCMVVGVERDGQRLQSPKSDLRLQAKDLIWLVGEAKGLQLLQASLSD